MNNFDDINKLFDDLNQPTNPPEGSEAKPAKGGYTDRQAKKKEIKANWNADNMGVDTKALSMRTNLKRVVFNESGITEAIEQLDRLPEPGEAIHTIMGGHFNGFDVIPAIHRMSGKPLHDLHIATLGFNLKNNKNLCQMIDDGAITGETILIASAVFAQMDGNVYRQAKENLETRGGMLSNTRNHAKIIACRCGDDFYVTEGSGNLRSCSSLEQLQVINSEELYHFHARWIRNVAENNQLPDTPPTNK